MINLWLALREDAEAELQQWAESESLTDEQAMVKDALLSHPDVQHIVSSTKRLTGPDSMTWGAYSMYVNPSAETMGNISKWLALYEGRVVIGGCWEWDGMQCGTSIDENGDTQGEPLFPIDMRMIGFMPDDVEYGADGNEISRIQATELKQINLMAGQSPRRFS